MTDIVLCPTCGQPMVNELGFWLCPNDDCVIMQGEFYEEEDADTSCDLNSYALGSVCIIN